MDEKYKAYQQATDPTEVAARYRKVENTVSRRNRLGQTGMVLAAVGGVGLALASYLLSISRDEGPWVPPSVHSSDTVDGFSAVLRWGN